MSEFDYALDHRATPQQSRDIGHCIELLPHTIDGSSGIAAVEEMPPALAGLFPDVYLVGEDHDIYSYRYVNVFYSEDDAFKRLESYEDEGNTESIVNVFTGENSTEKQTTYSVFWEKYDEDVLDLHTPLRQLGDVQIHQKLTHTGAHVALIRSLRFSIWVAKNGEYVVNRDPDEADTIDASDEAKSRIKEIHDGLRMSLLMEQAIEKLELTANGIQISEPDQPDDRQTIPPKSSLLPSDTIFEEVEDADYEAEVEQFLREEIAEAILEQAEMLEDRRNGIGIVTHQQASGLVKVLTGLLNK